MSEKVEKAIDITKVKLGQIIKDLRCPKCKEKALKLEGLYGKETKSHELECIGCCHIERVNPKDVEFNYEEPKEPKKRKGDN